MTVNLSLSYFIANMNSIDLRTWLTSYRADKGVELQVNNKIMTGYSVAYSYGMEVFHSAQTLIKYICK